jgi:Phosphotransferase enzyme family
MSEEMAAALARACPGFVAEGEPVRTGKGALTRGWMDGAPAFAKWLSLREEAWEARFLNEVDFYRAVDGLPAPVRIPRLLCGSRDEFVLVVERLDGEPIQPGRYLEAEVEPGPLRALLAALPAVHAWQALPAPPMGTVVEEVEERIVRYVGLGHLDEDDRASFRAVSASAALEFSHGDLVLSNVLTGRDFPVALVDWEFARWHLAGHDLAILWTLLQRSPALRAEAEAAARAWYGPGAALFRLNQLLAVARELKIYAEDPDAAPEGRVDALRRDLEAVRAALRASLPGSRGA